MPGPTDEQKELLAELLESEGWSLFLGLVANKAGRMRKQILNGSIEPTITIGLLKEIRSVVNLPYETTSFDMPERLKAIFE